MKFSLLNFLKKIKKGKIIISEDFSSLDYWNDRYLADGNSGSGSYGRLSVFKSKVINEFVEQNRIKTVIELGCGDGNQLKLANYKEYLGFDISEKALYLCSLIFKNDKTKTFLNYENIKKEKYEAELSLSLDVIFHLIEDDVFNNYMINLFELSSKFVIIYSSNYNQRISEHVKCRIFTDWIEENIKNEFKLILFVKNEYPFDESIPNDTSFSDFYIYQRNSN